MENCFFVGIRIEFSDVCKATPTWEEWLDQPFLPYTSIRRDPMDVPDDFLYDVGEVSEAFTDLKPYKGFQFVGLPNNNVLGTMVTIKGQQSITDFYRNLLTIQDSLKEAVKGTCLEHREVLVYETYHW